MHVTIGQTDQGTGNATTGPENDVGVGPRRRTARFVLDRDRLVRGDGLQAGHIYIVGTILVSTLIDTKAGKVRETLKKLSADGKLGSYAATQAEWLLLDMTQTEFPVYKPEYLYWDAIIMTRKLLLSVVLNFMTHTPQTNVFC